MRKIFFTLIVILFALILTSCATFKSGIEGKFNPPEGKNYGADGVSVLFIFSHLNQSKGYDAIPKLENSRHIISEFDDIFMDALNEFTNIKKYSTFTEYASDVNDPERRAQKDSLMQNHDFVIKIKFMREKSFTTHFLGKIVSTVSLTLIPIPYTYSYSVNTNVFNSKGNLIKTYNRKAALTKWVQTFLIFVYPFYPEKRQKEEIYVDFLHNIFKQIESENKLKKSND